MGHARAEDILENIVGCIETNNLTLQGVMQVSMDGPNVNWSFHKKFNDVLKEESGMKTMEVGSCGLHMLHNGFKSGMQASTWELDSF